MRRIGLLLVLALAACRDRAPERVNVNVDASQLYNSAGEVSLTDGGSLEYSITSDSYRKWYTAQQGLDRRIASRYGALLQPSTPSERNIDKAVRYLASEPQAKAAIEAAGMSIREFVVTTVALEQEMRVASERGETGDTMPLAVPYPSPLDSGYATSVYPPPAYPYPATTYPYPASAYPPASGYPPGSSQYPPTYTPITLPGRDSARRVDTVYVARRDTLPEHRDILMQRRDTIGARDTTNRASDPLFLRRDPVFPGRDTLPARRDPVRVDTMPPRRDAARRDTTVRRDTLRPRTDTLRPPPVDTLRR